MMYTHLILLTIFISTVGSLEFIAKPFNRYKIGFRKDNTTISCDLDDPNVDVWLIKSINKREKPAREDIGDRLEKVGQKFIINDVKLSDQGLYICEAKREDGTIIRLRKGLFYVNEAACIEQPTIKEGSVKIFEKGDTFTLRCTAAGQHNNIGRTLYWTRKNNESLASNEKVVSSVTKNDDVIGGIFYDVEALTVTNATIADAGVHICNRKIESCPDYSKRQTTITLQYKTPFAPTITNPVSKAFYPSLNSNFTLNCTSSSSPIATITWKKDDVKIKTCTKKSWCLLSWPQSLASYSGNYSCEAENSEGKDFRNIKIVVALKPKIESMQSSSKENLLTCQTSSGYPKPDIYWEKEVKCSVREKCNMKWKNVTSYASINTFDTQSGVKSVINFGEIEQEGKFRCVAINPAGISVSELHLSKKDDGKKTQILIGIFVTIVILLIIIMSLCIFFREKLLKKKYAPHMLPDPKFRLDPNRTLFEQSIELPYPPEWEFPKERLHFINSLGSGAFGQVWLATAKGIYALSPRNHDSTAIRRRASLRFHKKIPQKLLKCFIDDNLVDESGFVAVKTLKAGSSDVEYKDLASEIKVLIHIGSHDNIVNLLGACTRGGNLCAIIEYCPYGNLVNFLRPRRDVYSCDWAKQCNNYNDDFCYMDVAYMALQIANGMQFLSSKKLIHRDLAARNVLVGNDYVMKIADFGLSRNIDDKDYYFKESSGMLPVKWMAPESIFDKVYTIKSDVWSFGILLWEICTMGGSPYPGITMEALLDKLQTGGYRMVQPVTCPIELYKLMDMCWKECPTERPWFNEIVMYLNEVISSKAHITDNLAEFERLQSTSSESDNLLPNSPVKKKKGSLDTLLNLKSLSSSPSTAIRRKKSCDVLFSFPPTREKPENNNEELIKPVSEQRYVQLQGSTPNVLNDQAVALDQENSANGGG